MIWWVVLGGMGDDLVGGNFVVDGNLGSSGGVKR